MADCGGRTARCLWDHAADRVLDSARCWRRQLIEVSGGFVGCACATPLAKAAFIQSATRSSSADELFSVERLQRVFGSEAETILGPAKINYADSTSFRSERHQSARALTALDSDASRPNLEWLKKTAKQRLADMRVCDPSAQLNQAPARSRQRIWL